MSPDVIRQIVKLALEKERRRVRLLLVLVFTTGFVLRDLLQRLF